MLLLKLLFSIRGRVSRADFWYASLLVISVFVVGFVLIDDLAGWNATWILYPPFLWSLFVLAKKRYHDLGRSVGWLLLLAIPLLGPAWVIGTLYLRKGKQSDNRYGALPDRQELDYLVVDTNGQGSTTIVNDVTGLNPVEVLKVLKPSSVDEISRLLAESEGPVSVGGGHFSMGGQTASHGSVHLDLRGFNQILQFSPFERRVRVQSGVRWCDLQRFLDPHGCAVKIMQSYANFTVGGTLSVNAHGRYMGLGPVILSVRSIRLVLADGSVKDASPSDNAELFYGSIGGYNALGIIVEAELDVVSNSRVGLVSRKLEVPDYLAFFRSAVRDNPKAVFHNADLYPPFYTRMRSQTWEETDKPVTVPEKTVPLRSSFPLERYLLWAISETPFGKWRREFIIDPLLHFKQKVHWRNYEASYDVAELEPRSRQKSTYVLQEYFIPVDRFEAFTVRLREILQRHGVNTMNISIRHAVADPGSLLAWAPEEVFAFVMYYKQDVHAAERGRVGVWTRELIDAALAEGGRYYLPYETHATPEQFHAAYPRARELFALKRRYDPQFRFRNVLWSKYYSQEKV